ncbi:MAG: hypothetical protein NZ482_06425 [Gloeomargarita sp. SKYG98]|nr:hypothetical protein [Gloeomargarita sp. SKYG98]
MIIASSDTPPPLNSRQARRQAAREILAQVIQDCQHNYLPDSCLRLMDLLIGLSFGRLGAACASVRWLAKQMNFSMGHTRRLIRLLEQRGHLRRHARYRPGTQHRLSNVLEIPGVTAHLVIPWKGALPDGAAADLLPPPTLEQLIAGLEQVFAQLQDYADPTYARLSLRSWWQQAKRSPIIQQFCQWYAQQREQAGSPIHALGAYVTACIQRFASYNASFFEQLRQWLARYQAAEQARQQQVAHARVVANAVACDKAQQAEQLRARIAALEQALASIPTHLPLATQERMRAKYARLHAQLQAELNALLREN